MTNPFRAARSRWWKEQRNIEVLVDTAAAMLERIGHHRLVLVGQSPAWLGESMAMLAEKEGRRFDLVPVAFSGSSVVMEKRNIFCPRDLPPAWKAAADEACKEYRGYLETKDLSPAAIIRAHRAGQRTIFIDFVDAGQSFAGFLHIVLSWGKEEGRLESLKRGMAVGHLGVNASGRRLHLPEFNAGFAPVFCMQDDFFSVLASGDIADRDRLAPYYSMEKWGDAPVPEKGEYVDAIRALVKAEVDRMPPLNIPARPPRLDHMLPWPGKGSICLYRSRPAADR